MYDEGTAYTYSRCVEQCAADYAIQQCYCIDAYMPGINDDFIIAKMLKGQCKIYEVIKQQIISFTEMNLVVWNMLVPHCVSPISC